METKPSRMEAGEPGTPSLPIDIVVKVAFFIPDWSTVLVQLDALRPAGVLGPLEHLWQLKALGWSEYDLWPRLDLVRMTDAHFHVEGIAKYYSNIVVTNDAHPEWLRDYVSPTTCIHWMELHYCKGTEVKWLEQYDNFRMTSLQNVSRRVPKPSTTFLAQVLPKYSQVFPCEISNLQTVEWAAARPT
ncbi:hypothetical protein AC1031_011424 [Aphanomyces cochlioides]|nr:hypothetical protein AC1031_011424 [Aphanomyces cochlioides]